MSNIVQLYPRFRPLDAISGLYLQENLHLADFCVYANFLTSLDGRIGVRVNNHSVVPPGLSSGNDLRLFFELQAQCDCIVTHGGYLRSLANGELGDVLRPGGATQYPDLPQWRERQGLSSQPLVVVCSASLDFPLPDFMEKDLIWIATTASHDKEKASFFERAGVKVIVINDGSWVKAGALVELLRSEGRKTIYLSAGPKLFEMAVNDQVLNLLYMTVSHQLIGHDDFHTMVDGIFSSPLPRALEQKRLIYDAGDDNRRGQWYAKFACHYDLPLRPLM